MARPAVKALGCIAAEAVLPWNCIRYDRCLLAAAVATMDTDMHDTGSCSSHQQMNTVLQMNA